MDERPEPSRPRPRHEPARHVARQAAHDGELGQLAVLRFHRAGPHPAALAASDPVTDLLADDLDQALWFAGAVVSVYAVGSHLDAPEPVRTAQVVLTHASGAISHVRAVWGPPDLPRWSGFHVAGTTGLLRHDTRWQTDVVLSGSGRVGVETTEGAGSVEGPEPTSEEVRAVQALCHAVSRSLRTGTAVVLGAPDEGAEPCASE